MGGSDESEGYFEADTRFHFDTFGPAMLTTFILISGSWYDPMLDAMDGVGPAAIVFIIVVVVLGTYLIMNLFIAVLLEVLHRWRRRPHGLNLILHPRLGPTDTPPLTTRASTRPRQVFALEMNNEGDEVEEEHHDPLGMWMQTLQKADHAQVRPTPRGHPLLSVHVVACCVSTQTSAPAPPVDTTMAHAALISFPRSSSLSYGSRRRTS